MTTFLSVTKLVAEEEKNERKKLLYIPIYLLGYYEIVYRDPLYDNKKSRLSFFFFSATSNPHMNKLHLENDESDSHLVPKSLYW